MNVSFYTPDAIAARESYLTAMPTGTTIASLLSLEDLRHAVILAGAEHASRAISAALVIDSSMPQSWLRGGELVITTGTFLKDDGLSWINSLAAAKAAGLIVCTSKELPSVPPEIISHAKEIGLLLLSIDATGGLAVLLATLGRAIEGGGLAQMRSNLLWQRGLVQLAVNGTGFEELARAIAAGLGQPILIEDRQFNLLAAANPGPSCPVFDEIVSVAGTPVAILQRLEDSGVIRGLRTDMTHVYLPKGESHGIGRHIQPLSIGEDVHGFLSILEATGQLSDEAAAKLATAATAVTIEFLKQRGIAESEQKMRRDFFRDLLFAHHAISQETLHRRATYLGYQLSSSYWTLVIEFDNAPGEETIADELKRLGSTLNSLLSFRQALVITQPQGATVLYPVKEGQPTLDKIKQLAETIRQKILQMDGGWTVSIGIGQIYGNLLAVPKSYREASQAVKIGRALHGANGIHCFSDLGIYRMLLQFATSQNPNEFFCDALQRLLEYDQQADKELVKTLSAFLECNGNLTETSERLFIHRNTLKYRLERIRDITQIDLDDSEMRLMLHLGLKMQQILTVR
ncbi:MAG: helix-turn-helix domain-containing protein [Cyanobacteria bacterium NC_groundwater_1444_Ag_S-0.65um_54_12]|nr:helix-turn-helix domain-containing protein [Cyanobacteria bacterium NC_groundwater_1444_Ag_S-0.65um_54_12]